MPDGSASGARPASGANAPTVLVKGPGGRRLEMRQLLIDDAELYRARILSDMQYMTVFLELACIRDPLDLEPGTLTTLLAKAGVIYGIDGEALDLVREQIRRDGRTESLIQVAKGMAPKHGEEGIIEWKVRPKSREARYDLDAQGNLDYRRLNLIESAAKGQLIAVAHPPGKGTPGRNVLGQVFSASDGKPALIRLGKSVRTDESETKFFANADGYVNWESNTLSIETVYVVHTDVDYAVGHIDFIGEVVIQGAVQDEFNIKGGKGVTIHGLVGNSVIESDGDIELLGGMAGKGKGFLRCGGSIRAKYLDDTTAEVEGNVEVRREIVGCHIRSRGAILIPNGGVVGGDLMAYRGIEAEVIGSELGVTTKICAGVDYTSERQIQELTERIQAITGKVETLDAELTPVLDTEPKLWRLSEKRQELARKMIGALQAMREDLARAEAERTALENLKRKTQVRQVNVNSYLHPGVEFRFTQLNQIIKDPFRGPLSVVEDLKKNMVRMLKQFKLTDDSSAERHDLGGTDELE